MLCLVEHGKVFKQLVDGFLIADGFAAGERLLVLLFIIDEASADFRFSVRRDDRVIILYAFFIGTPGKQTQRKNRCGKQRRGSDLLFHAEDSFLLW